MRVNSSQMLQNKKIYKIHLQCIYGTLDKK